MVHLIKKFKKDLGVNFITPTQIRFAQRGDTVGELSTGSGMFGGKDLYGVTIRTFVGGKWVDVKSQSKMFKDKKRADNYLKKIVG